MKKSSGVYQGQDPLAGWQRTLTPVQVERVLNVLRLFGLECYTDSLEPDYGRLYGQSPLNRRVALSPSAGSTAKDVCNEGPH